MSPSERNIHCSDGRRGPVRDPSYYHAGRTLSFDPRAERFVNDAEADMLLTRSYRAPYVVPDQV